MRYFQGLLICIVYLKEQDLFRNKKDKLNIIFEIPIFEKTESYILYRINC